MKNKKPKMKKMHAAIREIFDREDLEDSDVKIIGVYASKNGAQKALAKDEEDFLRDICDFEEFDIDAAKAQLEDDCDRFYNWRIAEVEVEA